jgi:hypothetical protein
MWLDELPASVSGTSRWPFLRCRLRWPLSALLAWAGAWLVFMALQRVVSPVVAVLLACGLGTVASLLGSSWWRRGLIAAGFPLSLALLGLGGVLPVWAWLAALAVLLLVYPLNAWSDAPLFPTPRHALQGLAAQAPLRPRARVLDAGCGLGDGLQALRKVYPMARLDGLEWSWPLRWVCAARCPWARVRRANMWTADWSRYQMVYLFQRPESMARAAAKARAELAPGAWLVSLEFAVPGVLPSAQLRAPGGRVVWLYRMPLREADGA